MLLVRKLFTHISTVRNPENAVGLPGKEKIEVHPKTGALFFMLEVPF
ncbi:MAG: hypothetical protein KAG92_06945 [Deltaproteobacteria bacterium]|nr:hypothetical protein [Deltaproteobacteria bacterium]